MTCVDDPATIATSAGDASYTENAAATVVDINLSITNVDGLTITAASVSITGGFAAGQDVLDWVDNNLGDAITEGASTNQTVLLTGNGTAAEYEAALEAVTYANTSDDPSTAPRTITFAITTSAGSPDDTKGLTVTAVDDPPAAVNDSATVLEDAAATAIDVLGQRHRRRRRPEDHLLGLRPGQRHRGAHRRQPRRAHRADLPARPELLQQPARHHARTRSPTP